MIVAVVVSTLPYGCASVNPYYDAKKLHHSPNGFRNNYSEDDPRSLWQVIN